MIQAAGATPTNPAPTTPAPPAGGSETTAPPLPGLPTWMAYARDLRHFPGVAGTGWRSSDPDTIRISTRGEGWAKLAQNVLADTVHSSRMVISAWNDDGTGTPPANGSKPFWEDYQFMAQAVSALPHVTGWEWADWGSGQKYLIFRTDTEAAIDHLKPLVRPQLGGMSVLWRAGDAPFATEETAPTQPAS